VAAVGTTSADANDTRWWHMRLGHMSEKWITILSKKGCLDSTGTGKLDFCDHGIFGK